MGYYTTYDLKIIENEGRYTISEVVNYMKKKFEQNDWYYPFEYEFDDLLFDEAKTNFEFDYEEQAKWYEHHEEMLELSKQFPEIVFCLHGDGEEQGDEWYCYYKNGKKQYCPAIITFDEYDESKLR